MADIPENEPSEIRAGDTVEWLKEIDDYPPTGYTLYYAFRNASSFIDITAGASSGYHYVSVAASQTTGWTAGAYSWIAYVKNATMRTTVDSGHIDILPNLAFGIAYDDRSDARVIYDSLIAKYKAFIASGGEMQSMSVAGKAVTFRSAKDFLDQIKHWEAVVRTEEAAEAVANGYADPRKVGVRFTRL